MIANSLVAIPEPRKPDHVKPPRAHGKRVVVMPEGDDEESAGGIILPASREPKPVQYGEVLSVGPDVTARVSVGDRVVYPRRFGWELPDKFGGMLILDQDMLDLVVEE